MGTSAPTISPPRRGPAGRPPPMAGTNGGNHVAVVSAPGIRKAGTDCPPRVTLYAVEGWGKTTLGAYAPKPVFLMARGETGLDTLRQHNLVPDVDTFEPFENWESVLAAVDSLTGDSHSTVVLDALGGFERLCHEHVCRTQFNGDWGEKGFSSFQKGYDLSVGIWLDLLRRLEVLNRSGKLILILAHSVGRPFKNPLGPDYDRYVTDAHQKTWGVTHKWSDAVLFGNFFSVVVEEKKGRPKGVGGDERVLYAKHSDAYDAKNRFNMPDVIDVPNDPTKSWETIAQYLKGGK